MFKFLNFRLSGGAREDRTPDLLRARQALSQLSYGPILVEREGFEPSVRCRTLAFQASKLNHSDISPPVVEDVGLEPTQPFGRLLSKELRYRSANLPNMERIVGIEPTSLAWKARVLPIYDTRILSCEPAKLVY